MDQDELNRLIHRVEAEAAKGTDSLDDDKLLADCWAALTHYYIQIDKIAEVKAAVAKI